MNDLQRINNLRLIEREVRAAFTGETAVADSAISTRIHKPAAETVLDIAVTTTAEDQQTRAVVRVSCPDRKWQVAARQTLYRIGMAIAFNRNRINPNTTSASYPPEPTPE